METTDFKVKTEFINRDNGFVPGKWGIAIDLGYSAVKQFSPVSVIRFPSYAKRVGADFAFVDAPPKEAIFYKNNDTKECWIVGEKAQDMIESGDTDDSEEALYGRERYRNPMFSVLLESCLGLGLMKNIYTGDTVDMEKEEVFIQSGLPERYMSDAPEFKDVISGRHSFSIRVGNGKWADFSLSIKESHVALMSQPKGTLFSVCTGRDGKIIPDSMGYFKKSVIIFDAGFGTLDIFPILSGSVGRGATFADLGMKRIYQETLNTIKEKYGVSIPLPALPKYLSSGVIKKFNRKNFEMKEVRFQDTLQESCRKICMEALDRLADTLTLDSYDNIIVTGGTGDAWMELIEDKFKGVLPVIHGNINDNLPLVYSNVRGYYYYQFNKISLK